MVNHGPRVGCDTCKTRRIRCDVRHPACSQCIKSKRPCLSSVSGGRKAKFRSRDEWCIVRNAQYVSRSLATISTIYPTRDALENLILGTGLCAYIPNARGLLDLTSAGDTGTDYDQKLVLSTTTTIGEALTNLRQPFQTRASRRAQLSRYHGAVRELRIALAEEPSSHGLATPVFLFSLYEMIVGMDDATNKTWQQHFNGLLALMSRLPAPTRHKNPWIRAAVMWNNGHRLHKTCSFDDHTSAAHQTSTLLSLANLEMRSIALETERLFRSGQTPPRKLEVRRLRVAAKDLYRSLCTIAVTAAPDNVHPIETSRISSEDEMMGARLQSDHRDEYRALVIVVSSVLLKADDFLRPGHVYQHTQEYSTLTNVAQEASNRILSSALEVLHGSRKQLPGTPNDLTSLTHYAHGPCFDACQGLSLLWPLYCASLAPGLEEIDRVTISELLWSVGERAGLPCALIMATLGSERAIGFSDIVAGLSITSLLGGIPFGSA